MKANRVREELKITIEYIPSGYYDTDEDWKLTVKFAYTCTEWQSSRRFNNQRIFARY